MLKFNKTKPLNLTTIGKMVGQIEMLFIAPTVINLQNMHSVVTSCFSMSHNYYKAAAHCLLMNHSERVRWKPNKPTQSCSKFIFLKKKTPTKGFIKEIGHARDCLFMNLNPAAGLLCIMTGNRKTACLTQTGLIYQHL